MNFSPSKCSPIKVVLFTCFSLAVCPLPFLQAADQHTQVKEAPITIETVTLTGKVIDIQENTYVIKDTYGIKWEFHVDQSTEQNGRITPGVVVTAEVKSNGQAKKVKILGKG
jgi:hypothetical protein